MHRTAPVLVFLFLTTVDLPAQEVRPQEKRALTHDDYDQWKSMRGRVIRRDGEWLAYSVAPRRGDAELIVQRADGSKVYRYPCGTGPEFTSDGKHVVFRVEPTWQSKREHELKKLLESEKRGASSGRGSRGGGGGRAGRGGRGARRGGGDDAPKHGIGLLSLADGKVKVWKEAQSYGVPVEGPAVVVYHLRKPKPKDKKEDKEDKENEEKKEKSPAEERRGRRGGRGGRGRRGRGGKGGTTTRPGSKPKKEPWTDPRHKDGTALVIYELDSGKETRVPGVTSYGVTDKTGWLYYVCNRKDKKKDKKEDKKEDKPASKPATPKITRGLFARRLSDGKTHALLGGAGKVTAITFDREESRMAFCCDVVDGDVLAAASKRAKETEEKAPDRSPTADLYVWDFRAPKARLLVSHRDNTAFPAGRKVRASGLSFCRDGSVLLFGADKIPPKKLPRILDSEKVVLDLWHWKDPILQPMQGRRARQLRELPLMCAWHFDGGRLQVLSARETESVRLLGDDGARALATDGQAYQQMISWDGRYSDVHVVDTKTGTRRLVKRMLRGSVSASPLGRWLLYFEGNAWYSIDPTTGKEVNLTGGLAVPFHNELHDTPQPARPHGVAGWTEDDREVLLYDRYDIWKFAPDGSMRICVTNGWGRANKVRLRYLRTDPEARHVSGEMLLSALDLKTMNSGFFMDSVTGRGQPRRLLMAAKSFAGGGRFRGRRGGGGGSSRSPWRRFGASGVVKAGKRMFFTRSSFREYPDLWTTDLAFGTPRRLSDVNPQQAKFRWGDAELVRWKSVDGRDVEGILIKPDGFDPQKKYPMLVHFYEKMSTSLHRYRAPAPGTSPNPAYYVSNGYLWFTPDIHYRDGYPGESALKCIVPGVQMLIGRGFVKEDGIGAAGHSWGGYQTAYLVTRTDIFAAVESGAPVSNMTSAYGGIRWGSGMSRAFQYERTQSRIGGSLWMYPMRYLENSPLFSADKVNTPVLMLHNDQDGAVPWYQGIEYFCALRRLGKEVYMFNYVGAGHGLRKRQNTMDWTMRMQQYFDHHLKGVSPPKWMTDGVPYIEREREKFAFREPESVRERVAVEASMKKEKEAKKKVQKTIQKPGSNQRD